MRGQLTDAIQTLAKRFLGREITTTELRIYPYLGYVMMNDQTIDPNKMNGDDWTILSTLRQEGHIEGGMSVLLMTREFY